MKNKHNAVAKTVMKVARVALERNANQTTCNIIYQPKAPAKLAKFKKANK